MKLGIDLGPTWPSLAQNCASSKQAPVTPMRQNYEDRTSGDDTDTRASTPSISSSNLTPSKILFFVLLKFERKITTEIRAQKKDLTLGIKEHVTTVAIFRAETRDASRRRR